MCASAKSHVRHVGNITHSGFMLGCGSLGTVSASFRVSPFRDYELKDIPDFDMS